MANTERVDFYIHASSSLEALGLTACRLADKALQAQPGCRLVIRAADATQAGDLDDQLWSFRDRAFIPHALLEQAGDASRLAVLICTGEPTLRSHRDLLINIAADLPANAREFHRVAELVDADAARRAAGRERFRFWRDLGLTPATHEL